MRTGQIESLYDDWTQASYQARVRGNTFLWGSAGIASNVQLPLILHLRNDVFGETITVGTQDASGTQTALGTLAPGECYSIPILGIAAVYASCQEESMVACVIKNAR